MRSGGDGRNLFATCSLFTFFYAFFTGTRKNRAKNYCPLNSPSTCLVPRSRLWVAVQTSALLWPRVVNL